MVDPWGIGGVLEWGRDPGGVNREKNRPKNLKNLRNRGKKIGCISFDLKWSTSH